MDFKEKWNLPNQDEEALKVIAKDIFNGKIFTDKHCGPSDMSMVFMCLLFMGPQPPHKPSYPSDDSTLMGKRDNTLFDLVDRDELQAQYEADMKVYKEERKYYTDVYVKEIGMCYEYLSAAGPTSVNGYPCFMSIRLLNKEDNTKVWEFYETYKQLRETVDKF